MFPIFATFIAKNRNINLKHFEIENINSFLQNILDLKKVIQINNQHWNSLNNGKYVICIVML